MITNSGKEIISKYLLGQVPSYATHISIGCGAIPLDENDPAPSASVLSAKKKLDFEMSRVPISSKGFVQDISTDKIAFIAELPKENRFEITEVGVWSAGANSLAKNFDSRSLFDFSESWQAHSDSISEITTPVTVGVNGNITTTLPYFRAQSSNPVFQNSQRKARKEGPRFLDSKIFIRGDSSIIQGNSGSWSGDNPVYSVTNKEKTSGTVTLSLSGGHLLIAGQTITVDIDDENYDGEFQISATSASTISYISSSGSIASASATGTVTFNKSTHIHLNAINFNISQNSPNDLISFAISIIDKDATGNGLPDYVKILLEFYKNEITTTSGFAKKEIYISGSEFNNNSYKVIEIPISELITSADFSSTDIRICRVFCSIIDTNDGVQQVSSNHYIALDGIRIENISTENPVYKLVGYSIVRTDLGTPIYKFQNTNNYIDFRFNLDVG